MKPFLRWAGSKRQIIPNLRHFWDKAQPIHRYIEPFMGSACFFFYLEPESAVLSDNNQDLIATFRQVRDDPHSIIEKLSDWEPNKNQYYAVREMSPTHMCPIERAARFIYLNRYCFNGLYRTNKNGDFNVPFGGGKTGGIPSHDEFKKISALLANVQLIWNDFEPVVLSQVQSDDFVYFDPPYAVSSRRVFREYGANSFSVKDLNRLSLTLRKIDARGAKFLISYAYSTEGLDTFSEWNTQKLFVQRNISGFAAHRRRTAELIITNY